jgi:glycolate oxidase
VTRFLDCPAASVRARADGFNDHSDESFSRSISFGGNPAGIERRLPWGASREGSGTVPDVHESLAEIVGSAHLLSGDEIGDDYTHDEALGVTPRRPAFAVRPAHTEQVARIVGLASEHRLPVTARGAGTGLSGACVPADNGILISFERMSRIIEIDTANHIAVVEPGVSLDELDKATAEHGLVYPVFPGESSASLGGNVATNAGGMRAVKYGVTRHHVLGLTAVLGTGEVIETGGKLAKSSSGYDLTQLIVGSEGTLAVVTRATLKLQPRLPHGATLLAPFATLDEVSNAVPQVVSSGLAPMIVEYIDLMAMAAILDIAGLDLGIPDDVRSRVLAYLVVVIENRRADRLDEDTEQLALLLSELGAVDVFVLPPQAGSQLIEAREKAFWSAKAAGADDIIDMVVPRAAMPSYMTAVADLAAETRSLVAGCGHAGDGNVHLSVFQPDPEVRHRLIHGILSAGVDLGGAISGEHGIGTAKRRYLAELEDPRKLDLMRRIKTAFDPAGILNPGIIFEEAAS